MDPSRSLCALLEGDEPYHLNSDCSQVPWTLHKDIASCGLAKIDQNGDSMTLGSTSSAINNSITF